MKKWLPFINEPANMKILEKSIKFFSFLNSILFAGSSIEGDLVISDHQKIDPIRQDILRHLDAHSIGVKLIKDSIYYLAENEFKGKRSELFEICYVFLKNFVQNNPLNQM